MTSSTLAGWSADDVGRGNVPPRISSVPPAVSSQGRDAVELAAMAGLDLDPWQQLVLEGALSEDAGGRRPFEVAMVVPRQQGKNVVVEARELAGLFLLNEQLIMHSAHEFKASIEAFRRVLALIEGCPALDSRVSRVTRSHGDEGIELRTGQRLRFVARTGGSGRGFTADCVILDECFNLPESVMAALLPTMSARPNPQLWYLSSAGTADSDQLARIRERGRAGGDPYLAFYEWSADERADLDDRAAWAQANPAMGIRISEAFIAMERAAMPDAEFARERLGIWADPRRMSVFPPEVWAGLADPRSSVVDPVAFAVDVTPDRSSASIGIAGLRKDGLKHVEVIDYRDGTGWVPGRLAELVGRWRPCAVVLDAAGPAGSLLPALKDRKVDVSTVTAREMGAACGVFFDAVCEGTLRHLDQPMLNTALAVARKRPLGDAWAWHRRDPAVDISPLVAVTLALHGSGLKPSKRRGSGKVVVMS